MNTPRLMGKLPAWRGVPVGIKFKSCNLRAGVEPANFKRDGKTILVTSNSVMSKN